jgi:ComF family protein
MNNIKNAVLKMISFVYPVTCSCCGEDVDCRLGVSICEKCMEKMPVISGLACKKCGLPLKDGGMHCYKCLKNPSGFKADAARCLYLYEGYARKLILKFKYSDRMFLAKDFGRVLSVKLRECDFYPEIDLITSVPLNLLRRIKRGYNQSALLAGEISKRTGLPSQNKILLRKKMTKPQFKLSKEEREENIENSFYVKDAVFVKNKNVLLIDDIITTGATISACAEVLKKSGAKKVYALALARD